MPIGQQQPVSASRPAGEDADTAFQVAVAGLSFDAI